MRACARAKPIKLRTGKKKCRPSARHENTEGGVVVWLHSFLISAPDGPLYVPVASLLWEEPPSPTKQEALWALKLLRTFRQKLVCTSHVCCTRKALGSRQSLKAATTNISRDKWLPVTTAGRVLRLRMEERPPAWRIAVNILNKQSRTANNGWSSSLGVGQGANNSSP